MTKYQELILRQDLIDNPQRLYVFGDNMARRGMGGQALEMRHEPNAIGIPTKRRPSMAESAFFNNLDLRAFFLTTQIDFIRLRQHPGIIIWPSSGIGTGLAQLAVRAPKIWHAIEELRMSLENTLA